jgi:UDP-glucose 6-dehydrogenase
MGDRMKVAIVGSGYVGLVSAAGLCEKGHDVTCVDLNARVVAQINQGSSPIHEHGLSELLRAHTGTRLHATTNLAEAVVASDVTLVTVANQGREHCHRRRAQAARCVPRRGHQEHGRAGHNR